MKMSRRKTIRSLLEGSLFVGFGGLAWSSATKALNKNDLVLRPPGAASNKQFVQSCLKCGQCVEACPYDTLKLAAPNDGISPGTPYFEPRDIPCYMCTDYPCITACPSESLEVSRIQKSTEEEASINNAQMGLAVIHKETCIAYWGIQCDACYRACPLIDKAITLDIDKNQVTKKHANLKPIVHSDYCTGCGKCEQVCVTEKAAIFILPRHIATGKVGDHYLKSWEKQDKIPTPQKDQKQKNDDVQSAMDYLNNDDILNE
ncbi:ferredoxin-type protein NapG [Prolixibacteraceae bacterium JC049]|nr:ferredoxin-type protein NapG [Prolixibacteraceae bacterium JC049]